MNGVFPFGDNHESNWQASASPALSATNPAMLDWEVEGFLPGGLKPSDMISSPYNADGCLQACFGSFIPLRSNESSINTAKLLQDVDGCGSSPSSLIMDNGKVATTTITMTCTSGGVHSHLDVFCPSLSASPKSNEVQLRQAASGSSREDSEDDELEACATPHDISDPSNLKRARRMLSNRESARRSRKRKQDQLNELESQMGQLKDENTSLLSRYKGINGLCKDANVDKRILQAEIETLRTKVKIAEHQVKQVTNLNPALLSRSNIVSSMIGRQSSYLSPLPQISGRCIQQPVPNFETDNQRRADSGITGNHLISHTSSRRDDIVKFSGIMTPVPHISDEGCLIDVLPMQHLQNGMSFSYDRSEAATVQTPAFSLSANTIATNSELKCVLPGGNWSSMSEKHGR